MTKHALVVNCSARHYNLGARKLRDWLRTQGYETVFENGDPGFWSIGYDLVVLSVIFSWDAIVAREIAMRVKADSEVWSGGPGMFTLAKWWRNETGLECVRGLDPRFENQHGDYLMTFASRGCPVGCSFCIVPRLEGTEFILNWDFQPASVLCDSNLSALPVEFQEHIIRRYQESDTILEDANSGFEPRTFDAETFARWEPLLAPAPWRFAFDTTDEELFVRPMMKILRDVSASRKRVYCLIGNEPFEQCYARAQKIIDWGGEPFVQPMMPLNALNRDNKKIAYDWTHRKLKDFARYYNRWLWRSMSLTEYKSRKNEQPVFAGVLVEERTVPAPVATEAVA